MRPDVVVMSARGRASFSAAQARRLERAARVRYVEAPDRLAPGRFLRAFRDAEVAGWTPRGVPRLSERLLAGLPRLRAVAVPTTGSEWLDVGLLRRRGLRVLRVPDYCSDSAAEFALGLILALCRRIPWAKLPAAGPRGRLLGMELRMKVLGVVGLGAIGGRLARLGRALGMKVLGTDPVRTRAAAVRVSLARLLEQSDIVSLHLPLEDSTRGLIGERALADCKPGALLVNTARPDLVDEAAALRALRAGRLGGYAFDLGYEPAARYRALCRRPDVLCVPHIAWYTREALERGLDRWVDALASLAADRVGR